MNKMAIGNGSAENGMNGDDERASAGSYCKDYIRGLCARDACRYLHDLPPRHLLKEMFRFCHDFQNKGCYRNNCKFIHSSREDEDQFYCTGQFPRDVRSVPVCQAFLRQACASPDCKYFHPPDLPASDTLPDMNVPPPPFSRPPPHIRDDDSPPEAKFRRYTYEDNVIELNGLPPLPPCSNCDSLNHKVKLLHDNISVLLKKVADLTEKNQQLTSMNEFLLEQTTSMRSEQSCVITSRHGTSAPVSLATVSMTPVVSLAGALPTLVPANGATNLTLAPAASRAQIIPTPQILTVSTTQQLMGNSGTLIVTSAGAQQLMQVSDSGNLMGGGQTVVAVTPAQLTLAPPGQQLMSSGPQTTVVQQQLVQPHQHPAPQFTQQQHLQQSAQHLAAQQSAQHLAVQQSAQHLADLQSSQHLAQSQQLVHQTSTQQITISSTSQPLQLPNSQAQTITFPIISQSILPH
ncbi:zinc finger CCCH domain-containing protein 10-like [Plutella xylostella]|uniref:zinc finger CCCH domain-containing protein 10-like n=1 Tax=Plutella xylostella TaxID=51655 RepID=UPI0020327492|nr:zinc finger CCCH domain-containing protein 10-like [Plutella xylostella]